MPDRETLFSDSGFLKALFERSPVPLLVVDKRTSIVMANRQVEVLTGYMSDSLETGRKLTDLVLSEDREKVRKFLRILRTDGSGSSPLYVCRLVDSKGTLRMVHLSGEYLGDTATALLSLTDVTTQKEKEKQLQEARSRAEASDRLKTAFLGNLSHEIRTPMNAIVGFTSLIQIEELEPEKRKLYLNQILQGSTDLLQLIEKTIVISRIDMGQIKITPREFYVNKSLRDLKKKYVGLLAETGKSDVEILLEPGNPEEEFFVHADRLRIMDVLTHLLDNAVKFTVHGTITLGYAYLEETGKKDPDTLLFYVKDTGCGIPEDKTPIIFDRFVKLHDTHETILKGAGLGLAIAHDLVTLMNGEIWVESSENLGSKFYVSIPVSYTRTGTARPAEAASTRSSSKKYDDWSAFQLLLAEDTESNYLYIKELLAPTGISVFRARDGLEAVEIFKNHPDVDLVLMDILMPGQDGYEATRNIRKIRRDIPVIAQTAFTFEGEIQDGLYAGCFTDYIMKPFTRDMLLAKMKLFLPAGR